MSTKADNTLLNKAGLLPTEELNGIKTIMSFVGGSRVAQRDSEGIHNGKYNHSIDYRESMEFFDPNSIKVGNQIKGYWANEIKEDEDILYLSRKYNLPVYHYMESLDNKEQYLPVRIVNGMSFDLTIPRDMAIYKIIANYTGIARSKDNRSTMTRFYWYDEEKQMQSELAVFDVTKKAIDLENKLSVNEKRKLLTVVANELRIPISTFKLSDNEIQVEFKKNILAYAGEFVKWHEESGDKVNIKFIIATLINKGAVYQIGHSVMVARSVVGLEGEDLKVAETMDEFTSDILNKPQVHINKALINFANGKA